MTSNTISARAFFLSFWLASVNSAPRNIIRKQFPAYPTCVNTIYSPGGVQIRYKEPGICETTAGFFEARHNPSEAPTTLWLTGGPGDDSLLAIFLENGPCRIVSTTNLTAVNNPYSWNNASNMLYLSQPIGVGFSYSTEIQGWVDGQSGDTYPANATRHPPTASFGQWPLINASTVDTTELAAVVAYHTIQAFFTSLPQFDSLVKSRSFNLWTESFGGHYGPIFLDYFYDQNQAIANGSIKGTQLTFDTLGIGNGAIDYLTQPPYYPSFAVGNTYGIQTVNKSVHDYMEFALNMNFGWTLSDKSICQEAADMCKDNVLGPFESYSPFCEYDIRADSSCSDLDFQPMVKYLNQDFIQDSLGVNLNYTPVNNAVFYAFQSSGDWVYQTAIQALESLLDRGVRVALYYGDADFIENWFGGEAISLNVNYEHKKQFQASGYQPFVVDGTEYGAVRQYGNFSFLRIYDSVHQVPLYQPLAALSMYQRTLDGFDIATGTTNITDSYQTNDTAHATHTEPAPRSPTGGSVL